MNFNNNTIIPIKGDASFRKFYRKKKQKKKFNYYLFSKRKNKKFAELWFNKQPIIK